MPRSVSVQFVEPLTSPTSNVDLLGWFSAAIARRTARRVVTPASVSARHSAEPMMPFAP